MIIERTGEDRSLVQTVIIGTPCAMRVSCSYLSAIHPGD